jgi:hypothetical protein
MDNMGSIANRRQRVIRGEFYNNGDDAGGGDVNLWRAEMEAHGVCIVQIHGYPVRAQCIAGEDTSALRGIGREHGVAVMMMDMRWGTRDESTLDDGTWIECSKGIERCEEDSSGLFFVPAERWKTKREH